LINFDEWTRCFQVFLLHLTSVFGLFYLVGEIEGFKLTMNIKISIYILVSLAWMGSVITIYNAKRLTITSVKRWIVFLFFTLFTTFLAYIFIGVNSYSTLNTVIVMEPLFLCTLTGLASVKLRR
jgi:hypothetical protein